MPSWKRELKEQGVECLGVINYERLRAGKTGFGRWDNKKWVWDLDNRAAIVWDEVHRCKNPTAKNTKMLIAAKPYMNLMLSATVADSPTELRGVGYALGLFELQKYWNWCRAHGCKVNPWGAMEFDHKNTGALQKIHDQIMPSKGSRMSIEDMSGHFAENLIIDDPLDFSDQGRIQKLYEEMDAELEELKCEMASDSNNPAAQALVKQLRARQAVELCKVPLMVELIEDIRDSGRSAAVFVNFDATIKALLERLQQTEATVSIIRGGQSESEREDSISRFQSGESGTIICNMEAGGVGVSLHDTTGLKPRTALISPNFNAKSLVQVLGRIHRAGGKSPAIQRILVAEGTI
jgi:superfamily II DNA or RNA helicase